MYLKRRTTFEENTMKHIKWMSAVLLAALLATPAFAQTDKALQAKVAKTVEAVALKAAQKAQQTCVYCGEEITDPYQHCSAKNYIGLCSDHKKSVSAQHPDSPARYCSRCGAALSIDERYHGVEHHCKTSPADEMARDQKTSSDYLTPFCIYCNQEIHGNGQHCPATGYTALCSSSQRTDVDESNCSVPACCAKCGKSLSIDERYHGAKHKCKEQKKKPEYCIYCGEEIKTSGQICPTSECGVKCTVNCPDCGQNLRDPKNLGPDGLHRCRFKSRIKPAPIKK